MVWKPNVTVAAVIERGGKFLLIEEQTDEGLLFNQPAGHLEEGESLVAGVCRETLEEAAWDFTPEKLVGVYRWRRPGSDITYLRFAFSGRLGAHHSERELDRGIVRAVWMSPDEIRASRSRHRSPLVARCVDDFLRGNSAPLDLLVDLDVETRG
jgi:ADP-ribose pyrophosphatase YjhB (NUDIX family)